MCCGRFAAEQAAGLQCHRSMCLSNHAAVTGGNLRVLKVGAHGWGAAGADCLRNGAVGETWQHAEGVCGSAG